MSYISRALLCWLFLASVNWPVEAAPLSRAEVLACLQANRLIRGMHDTLGGAQSTGYQEVASLVGRQPELWSGDFGFSRASENANDDIARRPQQLAKMRQLGAEGKLLTLSWHQCNPVMGEPCSFARGVQTPLTDEQWDALLMPGTPLNQRWRDSVAPFAAALGTLQQDQVTVLLRLFHEANQPGMWWASADPARSIRLYRMLHHELTAVHGLHNLLWVWSVAYHPTYWGRHVAYYPGDDVVDIVGLDMYPSAAGVEPRYDAILQDLAAGPGRDKMLALSEVSRLPSREAVKPQVSYVVPWGINMLKRDNSLEDIRKFYERVSSDVP